MDAFENPMAQVRVKYVRVTNNGDIAFTDRHDGVPVRIEPGKSDNFPLDMAEHFFGGGIQDENRDAMFRHVAKRQGWNTPAHLQRDDSGKTLAERLFDKLDIKPVVFKMVEETLDVKEPIPADPEVPRRKTKAA